MELNSFKTLFTPDGRAALEAAANLAPKESDFLRHFAVLERRYPREMARAALETAILRGKAADKFPEHADRLFFTREALEQASSSAVSAWRSKRYEACGVVADLGCSIGGDTLTFAARTPVVGIDIDPVRLAMARANADALGFGERSLFIEADLAAHLPLTPCQEAGLFFDPARRKNERRARAVADYRPSLDVIRSWIPNWHALGVKIAPSVALAELSEYDAEIEFISLNGELKEGVLWFGALRSEVGHRRATVLPRGHTMTGVPDHEGGASSSAVDLRLAEPAAYLYEPDPAVIRAGLVRTLGAELDAAQLDPDIAFLTADRLVDSPFARVWPVEDWMPFHLKRLREYLRKRGVGKVTVKKRGSPIEPRKFIHDLRLGGDVEKYIVLTHLRGKPIVVVCTPAKGRTV
jgi:hypothetical protein